MRTGAAVRNWESYGALVRAPVGLEEWRRDILADPQTSGGLLIAVAPDAAGSVLDMAKRRGFSGARRVGRMVAGAPGIEVIEKA